MALDRVIALIFLLICVVYGYNAYFVMDELLPPFMRNNPIWPSTFPKVLSALGILVSLTIVLGIEKSNHTAEVAEINYRKLTEYKLGQAISLLLLMVFYAFALRPIGFLVSTTVFLVAGSAILGERRWGIMIIVSVIAAGFVWYLVDQVLGIFMRPLPWFLS
ncbi:tripartite tricarboxylate transporter TctB family protein [Ruegeria lacuscaerulensis]|uniref:tripartite tricarboxylate transporter TctB family protein n=1 Tax=Ruegeria lacuscaerulensis TaxID=55218 RepID=UPI00147AE0A2|nr:tripartite tricarboxylate transporter TctB family protein [Ruegeria lacuscaerulensis]